MTDLTIAPADRDLLQAFTACADQSAFAELVRRHGPMVYAACTRILGHGPDADDSFQATFVVLAKKAKAVSRPELLGNWLYGVAVRCAKRAKSEATRRQTREQPVIDHPVLDPGGSDWSDVRPVLDAELARLPEKLRAAVVLCELEGVPRPEAAIRLGVPEGTLSSRLSRAKESLRRRLVKRGIVLSAVGLGVVLANASPAAVPPELANAAVIAAFGKSAGAALTLAQAEVHAMFWTNALKIGLAAAVLAVVGGGAILVGYRQAVAAEDKKTDHDKIQGDWKITAAKKNGQPAPDGDKIIGATMTISADRIQFEMNAGYKLDPSTDPRQIDITPEEGPENEKGKVFPGIYKLDGNKLKIHFVHPGEERPKDFESRVGVNSMLLELERIKK